MHINIYLMYRYICKLNLYVYFYNTVIYIHYLQVHAVIRRIKSDYTKPGYRARKLYFIADSASENKNNTLFAYGTDMVRHKWVDEVQLLFGPVGHTHNGVDAAHKIHNQNVGANVSGDLGHFVQNYPNGFTSECSRPNANLINRTLDWTKYYAPHMRKIAGFTKTKYYPHAVRGFRIMRESGGNVSLKWKVRTYIQR